MAAACAVLTATLVVALLTVEGRPGPLRGWVKAAASTSFIATALAAGALGTGYGRWVLSGLALSWFGDMALVSRARAWFLAGLAAFLLAHVSYVAGFAARGADAGAGLIAGGMLLIPAAVVVRWLWPEVPGPLRAPVVAYVVVITAMVAMSAATTAHSAAPAVVTAAIAFYLSDLSVARDRFVSPGMANRLWGLPLYYLAQILFALSV